MDETTTKAAIETVSAYRARRRVEEERALVKVLDAMRATISSGAIERWLIAALAQERSEWSASEAVHALIDALQHRPADRPLDGLRNDRVAATCLEMFCGHFDLAEPRDGWRAGLVGDPFVARRRSAC